MSLGVAYTLGVGNVDGLNIPFTMDTGADTGNLSNTIAAKLNLNTSHHTAHWLLKNIP